MKARLFFAVLLAAALCIYGCTKTVYIIEEPIDTPVIPSEEVDPDDGSDEPVYGDYTPEDDEYYAVPGDGTAENPYTVSQVLEMFDTGNYEPGKNFYVKGIVSTVKGSHSVGRWLSNYYISDDGNHVEGAFLHIYLGYALGWDFFTSSDDHPLLGDHVIVYGKLTDDDGTPEIDYGRLYYWNGEFGDIFEYEYFMEPGEGTKESPYSVLQAIDIIEEGAYDPDKGYYVKGIVAFRPTGGSHRDSDPEDQWLNDYYISEEGNGIDCIYVHYGYSLGGEYFTSFHDISIRDQVIVYGKLDRSEYDPYGDYCRMTDDQLYYWNGVTAEVDEGILTGDRGNGDDKEDDDPGDDVCRYMTDSGFIQYCLENFDTDGNGKISFAEAEMVTYISCDRASDFAGIEYFPNLVEFHSTSVKYVDLRNNTELTLVTMLGAPIEQLDLSCNTKLTTFLDYAFCECKNLTYIILPEGITRISNFLFENCSSLASVTFLGNNLSSISMYAFIGCTSLASINLPESLTSLGNYAFYGCASLSSVDLPEKLTTIGDYAFYGCASLSSVDLPEGLTSLGNYAFYGCTSLATVTIPSTMTGKGLGKYVFAYSGLTSVSFPEGLNKIGDYAFYGCTNLATVTIPITMTDSGWGKYVFAYSGLTSVTFPEGLASIGDYAFYECANLATVTIPSTITDSGWGSYVFSRSGLTSVTLSEGLTSIGDGAFANCTNLTSVTLPESLVSIKGNSFMYCSSLITITLPEGLTSVGIYAFEYCSSLTTITLPEGLSSVGAYAFCECTCLSSVVSKPVSPPSSGNEVFYNIDAESTLYVPSESIEAYKNSDWAQWFSQILAL